MKKIIIMAFSVALQLVSVTNFLHATEKHKITLNKGVLVTKDHTLLIPIKSVIPTIVTDLKYATHDNFTHKKVYEVDSCYARKEVVTALANVQKELMEKGLGLKIWDAYRPWQAQCKFWELVPDENYVSDPRKGGRHTKGTALDVTLIDIKTGKEVAMPTEFDDFSEKAHHTSMNFTDTILTNRSLLKETMERHGFESLTTEWWHYDYKGWQNLPVIDLTLSDLDAHYKKS
ncbi:M15 family metallopeptidase [Vermiphilus pyriformis]|nr:MAG: M15 family metallopeptidase [Vermiphilus pyriformis]